MAKAKKESRPKTDLPWTPIKHKRGDLRVWWIPQIPGQSFFVLVSTLIEARLLLDTLAVYDLFQLTHRIKPDYCNTGGLTVFDGTNWIDWYSTDGEDIDAYELDALRVLAATNSLPVWEEL